MVDNERASMLAGNILLTLKAQRGRDTADNSWGLEYYDIRGKMNVYGRELYKSYTQLIYLMGGHLPQTITTKLPTYPYFKICVPNDLEIPPQAIIIADTRSMLLFFYYVFLFASFFASTIFWCHIFTVRPRTICDLPEAHRENRRYWVQ